MSRFSEKFLELAKSYAQREIAYPNLKGVTLAQWDLEVGWGKFTVGRAAPQFRWSEWTKWRVMPKRWPMRRTMA